MLVPWPITGVAILHTRAIIGAAIIAAAIIGITASTSIIPSP
jgi:hypothetical protein